jgi:glycosyltransferase EpsH
MISIVLPIYNVAPYLEQTLNVLLHQTYQDLQILCINDGSTDDSQSICQKYVEKDARVTLINQENQGASGARNTGIIASRGEFLMFLDPDDWIEEDTCEKAIRHQQETQADVVMWGYLKEYESHSEPVRIFQEEKIFEQDSLEWFHCRLIGPSSEDTIRPEHCDSLGTVWGKLYRTELFTKHAISFTDLKYIGSAEDVLANIQLFRYVHKAVYVTDIFYHYRKNTPTSITKKYRYNLNNQWEHLFSLIGDSIKGLPYQQQAGKALSNRKSLSIIGLGLNAFHSEESNQSPYQIIRNLLEQDWYRQAIKQLPLSQLPIHWKVFFFFAKHRLVTGVYFLLSCIQRLLSK